MFAYVLVSYPILLHELAARYACAIDIEKQVKTISPYKKEILKCHP